MHASRRFAVPSPRQGYSLVEVMVALVLVTVGLLGIAGASALSLRTLAAHSAMVHATRATAIRMAALEAAGCEAARSGDVYDVGTGQAERWHVSRVGSRVVLVDDTVFWTGRGRPRRLAISDAILC